VNLVRRSKTTIWAIFRWSRSALLNQIKAGAFQRAVKDKKTHNFDVALTEHFAEQAEGMEFLSFLACTYRSVH
jgi:hypothetical protein